MLAALSGWMTDAELILASQRDPARFRELYDRLADDVLAYRQGCAILAGGEPDGADAVIADVFVKR